MNEARRFHPSQLEESEYDIVSGSEVLNDDAAKSDSETSFVSLKAWIDEVSMSARLFWRDIAHREAH